MSRRARARREHEEAKWLGFAPEPDETGDASDGCGDGDEEGEDE